MKKVTLITLLTISAFFFSFTVVAPSSWTLDKNHGKLGFTITHLMISDIEGSFKDFDAKITAPNEDFTDAVVEMTAETASINTDNVNRDNHLKTADFFDATTFPLVTFKSTSFKKAGANTYKVSGDLTMHGITKPVILDVICNTATDPNSKKQIAGFKITGKLKRSDFGIGSKFPAAMLGDELSINANGEFKKQ
jgi:polyisoprenoid-binding protein YceI